jgi:hypothetical protein
VPHVITGEKYLSIDLEALKKKMASDFTKYIDGHCWKFYPESFQYIVDALHTLGLSEFRTVQVHDTPRDMLEFFVELEKTGIAV